MIAHFIKFKGKGGWVLGLPLTIGVLLFVLFDNLKWNDEYIRPIAFISSGLILWFVDGGPALLRGERNAQQVKHVNSMLWIDMKYWALVLIIIGAVLFGV